MSVQTHPISESIILSQSEAEFACQRKAWGARVIESQERFWEEIRPGFYQAVNWLARMPAVQAVRPTLLCWGYRTTLAGADAERANGTMPLNLLRDVAAYDVEKLHLMRRRGLRKSRNLVAVVALTGPEILQAEGYEVLKSSWMRTGYSSMPAENDYRAGVARTYAGRSLILGGMIQGKLGGYLEGYAVGSTAYIHKVILATWALPTQIGTALVVDFVQVCRQSDGIHEIVYGQHSREDPNLVAFKEGMGFPAVHIPSVVHTNPIIGALLRKRYPHVYYRLTGCE